jgi:hypothetical protein
MEVAVFAVMLVPNYQCVISQKAVIFALEDHFESSGRKRRGVFGVLFKHIFGATEKNCKMNSARLTDLHVRNNRNIFLIGQECPSDDTVLQITFQVKL